MTRNAVLEARRATVIIFVTLGLLVLISGIMLETAPSGPGSKDAIALGLTKETWSDIHVYASFIAAGAAVVHAYTNYRGILFHLGLLRPKRRKTK
ncbi:MAG: DUF4405 domain-containing protein [Desulfurococcales archaeon]|nr:DUF4405 domain-containing protein [Desulfurococcales archaeon]MEB3758758.1 DUF4405 domain-containing protein [Desulfurococcales archaeon]MEB3772682.1 DUF4405 domain-containing protein [Desulfurococcales archaeon]